MTGRTLEGEAAREYVGALMQAASRGAGLDARRARSDALCGRLGRLRLAGLPRSYRCEPARPRGSSRLGRACAARRSASRQRDARGRRAAPSRPRRSGAA